MTSFTIKPIRNTVKGECLALLAVAAVESDWEKRNELTEKARPMMDKLTAADIESLHASLGNVRAFVDMWRDVEGPQPK